MKKNQNTTHFPFDRRIDELGRSVVPLEIRRNFGWSEGDYLTLAVDTEEKCLILRKKEPETKKGDCPLL